MQSADDIVDLPTAARRDRHCVKVATAIRRARRFLGVDRATFAALLRDRLSGGGSEGADVPIDADAVAGWEEGKVAAPAVALILAAEVAGVEVDALLYRLPSLTRIERLELQLRLQVHQLRMLCKQLA